MANVLTGIRILCGIAIAFFPAFSGWFYFLYLLGGFTDAIDGTVARKTATASDFGAKFDTVADFVFAAGVAIAVVKGISVPLWVIVWVAAIASVKLMSHLAGYIKHHRLVTVHSTLNRVCGGVVYAAPLLIGVIVSHRARALVVIGVCLLTSAAAIAEAVTILGKR